jgi:hypothetical protein
LGKKKKIKTKKIKTKKKKKSQGVKQASEEGWRTTVMFAGDQKLLHSQSGVRGRIVKMEHPAFRASCICPLPPHVLPKPAQDVVVSFALTV